MKFPLCGTHKIVDFTVKALQGGCNHCDGDRRIPDSQLSEVCNMWWQNGALRTRPAFCVQSGQGLTVHNAMVKWKFSGEDSTRDRCMGRRFLRRVLDRATGNVTLQTGILTYDGKFVLEGFISELPKDVEGMVVEYPFSETEDVLIFLTNGDIYAQDSSTFAWRAVQSEAYVPCVLVGGEGVKPTWRHPGNPKPNHESRNLLTDKFCAKYTTTSQDSAYFLPYTSLHSSVIRAELQRDDGTTATYTIPSTDTVSGYDGYGVQMQVVRASGRVKFVYKSGEPYTMPDAGGDNLTIYASKERTAEEKKCIASMGFSTWFGGSRAGCDSRQFVGGNLYRRNRIYWSEQGQPLYYPESNYIAVGDPNQAITALAKQGDRLVIFKERELYSLTDTVRVSVGAVDGSLAETAIGKTEYFPITPLHASIGCTGPHTIALCGNRLCWTDVNGCVYTLVESSGGCTIRKLSEAISPLLSKHEKTAWAEASAGVYKGYYLLLVEHTVYALRIDEKAFGQSPSAYDTTTNQQLAWYVWQLPHEQPIFLLYGNGQEMSALLRLEKDTSVLDQMLHLESRVADGVYTGSGWGQQRIAASLCTKMYDFGEPTKKKQILRLRIGMDRPTDLTANISCLYDGVECGETVTLKSGYLKDGVQISPKSIRTTRFGVRIHFDGLSAVDSMVITYR